jgi:hypothetical protein
LLLHPSVPASQRDPRVDLLRGLSLLSIFIDHIPRNVLADFTLHRFGFSDAAELFVFLSGFSAMAAYSRVFERQGLRVGLGKVFSRCAKIYGVQLILLLSTVLIVSVWDRWFGLQSLILGPMLRDGFAGTIRGVTLAALPVYLDILPLYILLLAVFPVIRYGLVRSVPVTLVCSVALYAAANIFRWDLPSVVDPDAVTQWYFNPFTWQLIFVLGATFAHGTRSETSVMTRPSTRLQSVAWAYLVFAFFAVDAWHLWPPPLGPNFPGLQAPFAIFGNEPKSYVTPWRLFHILAVAYVALTSRRLCAVASRKPLAPILACGRQSLYVFAVGCLLALFGRLIFKTAGVTVATELLVNVVGLGGILASGLWFDQGRHRRRDTPRLPDTPLAQAELSSEAAASS